MVKHLLISAKRDSVGRILLSFMWLPQPENPCWVSPSPLPGGVSKSSAIVLSKCRSCFSLSGYHVMESRFCVPAASLVSRLHSSSGKHRIKDWNKKLVNKGCIFFVATKFGETEHLCPTPAQHHDSIILWEERVIESVLFTVLWCAAG